MVSGAVIVNLYGQPKGEPLNFACGAAEAIEKGQLLGLSGANAVSKISGASVIGAPVAGIAAHEKVSGATTIGVWQKGIFLMECVEGARIGIPVIVSGADTSLCGISGATGKDGAQIVGVALDEGERDKWIRVRLGR